MARYRRLDHNGHGYGNDQSLYSMPYSQMQELPEMRTEPFRPQADLLAQDPFWQDEPCTAGSGRDGLDDFDRQLLGERVRQTSLTTGSSRVSLPPRSARRQITNSISPISQNPMETVSAPYRDDRVARPVDRTPASQTLMIPSPNFHSGQSSAFFSSSPAARVSRRKYSSSQQRIYQEDFEQDAEILDTDLLEMPERGTNARNMMDVPVIQGISLVPTHSLPDRFRSIFPFKIFNAVQSRCFYNVYETNDNMVLSAPTGSGKTVILELAICKLLMQSSVDSCKIVYVAPTKSLCSERQRDWEPKFKHLGLQCREITGDTDYVSQTYIQQANLIITTPEKWDSMTRRWKDQLKLMQLVRLFLVDEVHILKESRGAALEAIVSRMKSTEVGVRFIALSATVPNSQDVAKWLGRSSTNKAASAHLETFGEEFRPVPLQKHVVAIRSYVNDFAFDQICDGRLFDIICKHSAGKPVIIFCSTRKSAETTAKMLTKKRTGPAAKTSHLWPCSGRPAKLQNEDLEDSFRAGVAFHHAGLDPRDRDIVENAFLHQSIGVICCTSTLAVGVNLPCHLVIIKNTVTWQKSGLKEYSGLETIQMLGRAGRPQFDHSAVAVIITKVEKAEKYEKLVAGEELLESCLHLNLIEHLNAEISLGTISSLVEAKRWLSSTFLYVRLSQNPAHYQIEGIAVETSLDVTLEQICGRDIRLLQDGNLVSSSAAIRCTDFGDAMARYCIKFATMKTILELPQRAKLSEILSALTEAEELHEVRFRSGEKPLFKAINSANGIKFPVQGDIALASQKRSLLIQAELGGVDLLSDAKFKKHRAQYHQDLASIFSNIHRLIRCVADCQVYLQDGPAMRHALELARSLGARVWDNSPLQLKQLSGIGPVAVRKLVQGGVNSIEALEATEPYRINSLLTKNPGFGEKLSSGLKKFPKPRVTMRMIGQEPRNGRYPLIRFKAELGFLNETIPKQFNKKAVYVCFLAERSDGFLIDFKRIGASYVDKGDISLSVELMNESQYITGFVMCDEIAGTLQSAELKPSLPSSSFPAQISSCAAPSPPLSQRPFMANTSKRRSKATDDLDSSLDDHELWERFSDDILNDTDFLAAEDLGFVPIDEIQGSSTSDRRKYAPPMTQASNSHEMGKSEPVQLANGKWACNHNCKDKTRCKHMCCRDGLDKPPVVRKSNAERNRTGQKSIKQQPKIIASDKSTTSKSSKFPNGRRKLKTPRGIDTIDLSGTKDEISRRKRDPLKSLNQLHQNIVRNPSIPTLSRAQADRRKKLSAESVSNFGPSQTSDQSTDFWNGWMDDAPLLDNTQADKSYLNAGTLDATFSNASADAFAQEQDLGSSPPTNSITRNTELEEIETISGLATRVPPSSSPILRSKSMSMNQQPKSRLYSEAEATSQHNRVACSRSPSPNSKRQKFNAFEPITWPELDFDETDKHKLANRTAKSGQQLKDMEGIDPDLFAQFRDLVEFED